MTDLPDPDSPAFRLLVLRGRQQAIQEATTAFHQGIQCVDTDNSSEAIAVDFARCAKEHGEWLHDQMQEISQELGLIADELGITL